MSLTNDPPSATETLLEMKHSAGQKCQLPTTECEEKQKSDGGSSSHGHAGMISPLQTVDLEKTAECAPTLSQSVLTGGTLRIALVP